MCGLVCNIGAVHFVSDNVGCFAGRLFSTNGCLVIFGSFVTYVATEVVCEYPAQVLVATDPPTIAAAGGWRSARPKSCGVMMAGTTEVHTEEEAAAPEPERRGRHAKQRLEREVPEASHRPVRPEPLQR